MGAVICYEGAQTQGKLAIHAEAYAAGEMAMVPLASIQRLSLSRRGNPTPVYDKMTSNIQESFGARGAMIIALATEGDQKSKACRLCHLRA